MNIEEDNIGDVFNINKVLTTLFSSTKRIANEKSIELIYEMDTTIPRKLRGDSETLLLLLSKILTFVFQKSDRKEIVLSLSSPKDFLYEEYISFKIQKTNIAKEKILAFLKINANNDLEVLGGKIIDDHKNISDIHLSIPFKNFELGFRRHYRLPDKNTVGKKILLYCSNDKTAQSLKKMFEYFLYDIDIEIDGFKKHENDLTAYDILIISEKVITKEIKETIANVQKSAPLKYVLLQESNNSEDKDDETDSEHFIKPITQEKIFDLIVSLFKDETETGKMNVVQMEDGGF